MTPSPPARRLSLVALLSALGLAGCGTYADSSEARRGPEEPSEQIGQALTGFNVTTRAYNAQRTGANVSETALTPSSVNLATFAKLFTISVDDQVYAQPL